MKIDLYIKALYIQICRSLDLKMSIIIMHNCFAINLKSRNVMKISHYDLQFQHAFSFSFLNTSFVFVQAERYVDMVLFIDIAYF